MNVLDVILVLFMVAAAVGGYRLGLLARAGSWLGFGVGLLVGARLAPPIVRTFEGVGPLILLILALSVVLGLAVVGQAVGMAVGAALRRHVPHGPVRAADHAGGAVAGVVGVLVLIWLLLPAMGGVPGQLSLLARTSSVVGFVSERAPAPPDSLRALHRIIGDNSFPEVFVGMQPAPVTGPPPDQLPLGPDVLARVASSTVNVEAVGCGGVQEGSGFSPAPGIIVTNAHVVAGTTEIRVLKPDGVRDDARVVSFDGDRDIAILEVPGLGQDPLPIGTAAVGDEGAIFGHPGGQDELRIAPAGIREEITAVGRDIYGQGRISRQVYVLAADLHQGDSGAALADPAGNVVGVAFAIAPDRPQTAYALTSSELRAALDAPRDPATSTGSCLR
ncbi:MAG TPA: MarP family serine protease [Acidimicrobiales bacterium]|nr:MarP family serine protease [Acidimicrobiales bacterium]